MTAPPLPSDPAARPIVVMGVSGSGKSVVGEALAARLGLPFRDGDGFHPEANVRKMSSGVPLVDEDRWPWLDAIGAAIREAGKTGEGIVVACSALRRIYRDRLTAAGGRPILFVHLAATRDLLEARLGGRKGHFMPKSLLDSQLATLEPPGADELAIRVDVHPPVEEVVDTVIAALAIVEARASGSAGR